MNNENDAQSFYPFSPLRRDRAPNLIFRPRPRRF
jgi:hypothetical protein